MEVQSLKIVKILEKISKASIYLAVFLVPLFFLPWTANVLDFNKQALLGLLVFIGLLSWFLKVLVSGQVKVNSTFLSLPIVIFLFFYGLSTIFSLSSYGSFWGFPLNISAGFLSLLGFVLFYFLISNVFNSQREVFWLVFVFLFSAFLAIIFGTFQIFGKFLLPWDFTKFTSFNTIGTVNSLGVFISVLLPLTIALLFLAKRLIRLILVFFALTSLIYLILLNFWIAWISLISGLIILIIFGMVNLKKTGKVSLILLPMSLLVVSLFFMTFKISLPGFPQIPIEVSPSYLAEINIIKEAFGDFGIKEALLGTGPGTFIYNFSKFKSLDLNQTAFWNVRFASGASEILDKLITTGIFGILSLFFVFGMFFWLVLRYLKEKILFQKGLQLSEMIILGIFSSFLAFVFSQFFYPANFSLNLIFWLLIGVFAVIEKPERKIWTLEVGSRPLTIVALSFLLVFIFGLGLIFIGGQKYWAEIKYLQGLNAWQQGQTEKAINNLSEAINLNPDLDRNFRDISQLYLVRLNELLQRPDLPPEELANQSQTLIENAVNSAKGATDISPENVANWNVRGFVYRNTIGLLGGAEDWAIKSYQRALELEPTNPYIFTEIGRVFLQKADLARQTQKSEAEIAENLSKAKEKLEKAIELKADFSPAHFQIAMIYIREGKTQQAIEKLEATKQVAPFDDTGLAFQLGVIYYNDEQFDKAKTEFERAVRLDENYSNARYFLGLIYDQEGKKEKAIEQFEKIASLNPDNEEVKKIISNLKAGKPALEGIRPAQPPIEEKPVEIE